MYYVLYIYFLYNTFLKNVLYIIHCWLFNFAINHHSHPRSSRKPRNRICSQNGVDSAIQKSKNAVQSQSSRIQNNPKNGRNAPVDQRRSIIHILTRLKHVFCIFPRLIGKYIFSRHVLCIIHICFVLYIILFFPI